jgi:four helix bundle protein
MKEQIQLRTKKLALEIIRLSEHLPNKSVGWTFSNQIIRCSTSVAANYRAVCRAKSDKDFISKMETVIEEADETLFWLEMIEESEVISDFKNHQVSITNLKSEANELISIFVSSVKTVKQRLNQKSSLPNQKSNDE